MTKHTSKLLFTLLALAVSLGGLALTMGGLALAADESTTLPIAAPALENATTPDSFQRNLTLDIGEAAAPAPQAAAPLTRKLEPVSLSGSDVPEFQDFPVDQFLVYIYRDGSWQQIPSQVDEVWPFGLYAFDEDGLFDNNDEIVFMARDMGQRGPRSGPVVNGQPIGNRWYEIEVTDPLNTDNRGWAYLVHSALIEPTTTTDYVDFNEALHEIDGALYTLRLATDFAGFERITLGSSSVDILDRTKARVQCNNPDVCPFTEENITPPADNLIKDGPVRAILRNGQMLAYGTMLVSTSNRELPEGVTEVRFSTDFTPEASGSTLYSAVVPAGVTVDGTPDLYPAQPLSPWWQLSTATGTLVQVADWSEAAGTQRNFYQDDLTINPNDTGDQRRYGDVGIRITNPITSFSSTSTYFFLPGTLPKVGNAFAAYVNQPLTVATSLQREFVTQDVELGEPGATYLNIEFAPGFEYASWIEQTLFPFDTLAWICGIDPNTGDLIPSDGRGFLVGEIINRGVLAGSPQWGEDENGPFVAIINQDEQLTIARPLSPFAADVTVLPTPSNPTRLYPYPAHLPDSPHSYIAFLQLDTNNYTQAYYMDLSQPLVVNQVTFGDPGIYPPLNAPPIALNIHRWFYSETTGEPIFLYGYSNTVSGKVQIKQFDVSQPGLGSTVITDDQFDHIDDFPTLLAGERYIVGGVNNEAEAKLYQRPGTSEIYDPIQTMIPYASELITPTSALGFEAFLWEGQAYASFQIRNDSTSVLQRDGGGEVWLTTLGNSSLMRMVSDPEEMVRADPEFFLGANEIWVYYHAKDIDGGKWTLRRARTGLTR